ncbi:MAG TPA: tRNA dihydrouridine synthase DusB, partial [Alphaproteobacteria bacterium]|nr:tRNA dihydrouridine synthase DusB [Alphaproteobacteria bacterium]
NLNAADLARRAVDAGARMITVHARTRQQFYKGEARWHLVRPVVEAVDVPVVVNGDIVDLATAREALRQSGAAAVMIGRGAQGRPWIVGQIGAELEGRAPPAAPHGEQLAELIAEQYEAMLAEYGTPIGVRAARKHLDWYLEAGGGPADRDRRKALLAAEEPETVLGMIAEIWGGWREAA